jgi:hypothetical protein
MNKIHYHFQSLFVAESKKQLSFFLFSSLVYSQSFLRAKDVATVNENATPCCSAELASAANRKIAAAFFEHRH